jgi:hypothetical protein
MEMLCIAILKGINIYTYKNSRYSAAVFILDFISGHQLDTFPGFEVFVLRQQIL